MDKVPTETSGIIESILSTMMFFSPNFLFYFLGVSLIIILCYNFIIMFMMISTITNLKFSIYSPVSEYYHKYSDKIEKFK